MKSNNFIGITYGDPTSVGPEILLKTLKNWNFKFKPFIIGSNKTLPTPKLSSPSSQPFFLNSKLAARSSFIPGKPTKLSGLHSYESLKNGVSLAKRKKIKALITGPVSKHAISLTKDNFYGQTEEIAKLSNVSVEKVIMLFVGGDLRVALFTRHIPINQIANKLTLNKLKQFLLLLNNEIKKWFFIKNPRIAILGLNPHASESGLIGSEEQKIIIPTIKSLNSKGLKLFGPFSPDAILAKAGQDYLSKKKQKYDVYVSFYHDQALPMFKAVVGFKGVNVTLGLPFLRVSVDHGTAFDIAGKNKASIEGLVSAIRLVEKMLK